jgi:hypothetical protein
MCFWHIWIGLDLNMNRFYFFLFFRDSQDFITNTTFFTLLKRNTFGKIKFFRNFFVNIMNILQNFFLSLSIYFKNSFLNHKKVFESC